MPRKSRRRSTPRTKTQTRKRSRSTMRRRSRVKRSSRSRNRVKSRLRSRQARSNTINFRGGINTALAKKVAGVTAATGAVGAASYYYVGQNRKQKELTIKKFLDSFPGVLKDLDTDLLEGLLLAQGSPKEQLESILKTMLTPESTQLQKFKLDDVTSGMIVNKMKEDLFKFDLSTVLPLIKRALQGMDLLDSDVQQRLTAVKTVKSLLKKLNFSSQRLTPFFDEGGSQLGLEDLETQFINNLQNFKQSKIKERERERQQTLQTYLDGLDEKSQEELREFQKCLSVQTDSGIDTYLKVTSCVIGKELLPIGKNLITYVTLKNADIYKTQILAKIDEVLKSNPLTSSTSSPLNTPSNPSNPTSSGWLSGWGTYFYPPSVVASPPQE